MKKRIYKILHFPFSGTAEMGHAFVTTGVSASSISSASKVGIYLPTHDKRLLSTYRDRLIWYLK